MSGSSSSTLATTSTSPRPLTHPNTLLPRLLKLMVQLPPEQRPLDAGRCYNCSYSLMFPDVLSIYAHSFSLTFYDLPSLSHAYHFHMLMFSHAYDFTCYPLSHVNHIHMLFSYLFCMATLYYKSPPL